MRPWALLAIALTAVPTPVLARSDLPRNFHPVEPGLWRGGAIESMQQLKTLRDRYGVTTVVCLAKDSLGPGQNNEFVWGRMLGITVIKAYMTDVAPTAAQWKTIRAAMEARHAYIHCKWGADRTGAVVAKYREEVDGWDARRSFTEARRYGFKPFLRALRRWIEAPADAT